MVVGHVAGAEERKLFARSRIRLPTLDYMPVHENWCCGAAGLATPVDHSTSKFVSSVPHSVVTPTGCPARLELVPAIGHLGTDSPHDFGGGRPTEVVSISVIHI